MPTYEYACTSCGRHFDVQQSFSDAPLEKCEVCGGALKRVFHPVGIVLKGSGFYATDNRSKKTPVAASDKSETKDAATPATGSDKSDKPASDKTAGDKPAATKAEKKPEKKDGAAAS